MQRRLFFSLLAGFLVVPAVLRNGGLLFGLREPPAPKTVDSWGAIRDRQWQRFLRESLRLRNRTIQYSTGFYAEDRL